MITTNDSRRRNRNLFVLVLLCVLAYLPALAALLGGSWPFFDDAISLFNIWHVLGRRGAESGVVPLWNPYLFCGMPFFANNQSALLYPPNVIYLIMPVGYALLLDALLHNILLAWGAYFLGRAFKLSRTSSFVMALAFALGGAVSAHIANGHMTWHAARAYLPWELSCLLLYLRSGKRRFAWYLAPLLALQVAAGYPPIVMLSATFCMGLLVAWLMAPRRLPAGWPVLVVGVVVLTVALSAIYVLPLAELSRLSVHGDDMPWESASFFSGTWKTVARLLSPGFFGNNGDPSWSILVPHEEVGYIGILPLLCALAVPMLMPRNALARRGVWLIVALLVFSILMAMGKHLPLYRLIFDVFPPLRQTRVPARWMEVFYYGVAILCALGYEKLIYRRSAGPRAEKAFLWMLRGVAIAFALLLVLLIVTPAQSNFWMSAVQQLPKGRTTDERLQSIPDLQITALVETLITLFIAGIGAFYWQKCLNLEPGRTQYYKNILLALVVVDLLALFWRSTRIIPSDALQQYMTLPPQITARYDPHERWDTNLGFGISNICPLNDIDTYTGYDALNLKRFLYFARGMEPDVFYPAFYQPSVRTPLLRVAGVTHTVDHPAASKSKVVPGRRTEPPSFKPRLELELGKFKLWKWSGAWPRAYVTRSVHQMPEDKQLPWLTKMAGQKLTQYPAVVSSANLTNVPPYPMGKDEGVLEWSKSFDRISLRTRVNHDSVLVFSDTLYPGWKAFANGKPVHMEYANFLFRGVQVPRGEAEIEMVYEPQSYRVGMFLSLCGLGAFSFLGAGRFLKKSQAKPAHQRA